MTEQVQRRYPIGIQTFEEIRKGGYLYFDLPFMHDGRSVHRVGLSFSSKTRTVEDFKLL